MVIQFDYEKIIAKAKKEGKCTLERMHCLMAVVVQPEKYRRALPKEKAWIQITEEEKG